MKLNYLLLNIFNQRLLNYKQTFSSSADSIFFAQFVLQQLNLNNEINIAMKKVSGNSISAGMFSQNFNETVENLIQSNQGFTFMNEDDEVIICKDVLCFSSHIATRVLVRVLKDITNVLRFYFRFLL